MTLSQSAASASLPDLDTLSLERQVAQMFVVRASGFLFDSQIRYPAWEPRAATLQRWIADVGVGGVILVDGSAPELMLRTDRLQGWAEIPLLVSADIEEGVGQRFAGATWFPPPMAIGDIARRDRALAIDYAQKMGRFTASEALAIGINWILAPVVDANNNPENPVINVRSFGPDPAVVSELAAAFVRGTQEYPVLNTAKHFPGHGDTSIDSHLELPTLPHSPERLLEIELPTFLGAIAAGVDGIMSAHLLVPAWDAERPATLSPEILTGRLREELGFEGLIVTDALVMGAIAKRYDPNEATVLAVEAGADIILMPVDPEGGIRAICDAVRAGRISPERIRQSVERIWQAKGKVLARAGSEEKSAVSEAIAQLATPAAIETAAGILQNSLRCGPTLESLPKSDKPRRNLIVIDDPFQCPFLDRQAPAIAIPEKLGYELQLVARSTPSLEDLFQNSGISQPTISANHNTDKFDSTLLQVFVRGNPFGTSAALTRLARFWLNRLLEMRELQAVAVYGSPYTLDEFLQHLPPQLPYAFSYGQMPQAQQILLSGLLTHLR
ncbi:MAG: glycoside hydrolase family 3 N-terminal domain-containing protein [Cyanobacteriota bacterium]|nr:glycoside hydrolase family 3 N-terminal domain-containing protein [Cyanobacteriota bacterium]